MYWVVFGILLLFAGCLAEQKSSVDDQKIEKNEPPEIGGACGGTEGGCCGGAATEQEPEPVGACGLE